VPGPIALVLRAQRPGGDHILIIVAISVKKYVHIGATQTQTDIKCATRLLR
jgi:hypothetical protein